MNDEEKAYVGQLKNLLDMANKATEQKIRDNFVLLDEIRILRQKNTRLERLRPVSLWGRISRWIYR